MANIEDYKINDEPFYQPVKNEILEFEAAYSERIPLILKGPTGCGKTRFIEHMAWRLKRPLITVACHEDMTATDLVGRFILRGDETVWQDGPLTLAAQYGAICYLDEVVEARQDTTVIIHPLTDQRRTLPIEKKNEQIIAHPEFYLVMSYNPGYQSAVKDLKESTKQRFAVIDFDYADFDKEKQVIKAEALVNEDIAVKLVKLGIATRNLRGKGLEEGASTRTLIRAGALMRCGIAARDACTMAVVSPLSDQSDMREALNLAVNACFGE